MRTIRMRWSELRPAARERAILLLVFLVVLACFAPDLRNAFVDWDDTAYIVQNARIRTLSLETATWAFTEFHVSYWAPLTWLSFAVDHAIWGLDPVGYHLTNDLLHALVAALFFLVTHRLLRSGFAECASEPQPGVLLGAAAVAALLFGIHPLRVESVAWAAERKDVLSMAFGMGAALAYLRHAADRPAGGLRSSSYWLALGLYVLSLLSKATLVTLPVALLIVDWCPLGRLRRGTVGRVVLEKAPLLAFATVATLITARAMGPSSISLAELGLSTRVVVAFRAAGEYLRLTVLPLGISPVYFHPGRVPLGKGVLAIAAILLVSAGCVFAVRRWRAPLAGWLVYLVALSPVLGIFQNGGTELAGRFTYFPSTALAVLAGAAGVALWKWLPSGGRWNWLLPGGTAALLVALAAVTVRDIGFWKDDIALWSRVIEVQPHRFGKAYYLRAGYLNRAGRHEEALADANEALSIAARKGFPGIHENYAQVARVRRGLGDLGGAEAFYEKAVAASAPPFADMYRAELDAFLGRSGGGDSEGSTVHAP
jgi:tetratricopeptide (TPR) repeat protein